MASAPANHQNDASLYREPEQNRYFYQLIISQLQKDGYSRASEVLSEEVSLPPLPANFSDGGNRLWRIFQKGLQKEREERPSDFVDKVDVKLEAIDTTKLKGLDFDVEAQTGAKTRNFPNYQTRFITTHKNACRVAKFSPDGRFVATGSTDTSIKMLDVEKMKTYSQIKNELGDDFAPLKPVIRTFYDHNQAINDVEFHPDAPVLMSCSKDCTIKFYDYNQQTNKKNAKFVQDSYNVRSISVHPSGDYLLAGTEHPILRLWDLNTGQCFISTQPQLQHSAPINQVKYAPEGNIYASCSKDGDIKLWDTITNKVINTLVKPHSGLEPTTVVFSRNQKYLLSSGKDGTLRLWELTTGRQMQHIVTGPQWKNRIQVCFSYNEDYIISSEESSYSAIVWDTRTGELVQRLSGHTNVVVCIASSPVEPAIFTCSNDHRGRFWVEENNSEKI